jgi:hypothetical protein
MLLSCLLLLLLLLLLREVLALPVLLLPLLAQRLLLPSKLGAAVALQQQCRKLKTFVLWQRFVDDCNRAAEDACRHEAAQHTAQQATAQIICLRSRSSVHTNYERKTHPAGRGTEHAAVDRGYCQSSLPVAQQQSVGPSLPGQTAGWAKHHMRNFQVI